MYRLLIADSDERVRAHVRTLLPWSDLGIDALDEAATYDAALDMALRLRPKAALVALKLDGRHGYDLVAQLLAAGLRTSFCIMADSSEPAFLLSSMRAGARDYLLTPLSAHELRAFLARTASAYSDSRAPAGDGLPASPPPIPRLDAARLSPLTRRILTAAHAGLEDPPVSLISIAETLHMNSKYLGRVFLRDTGMKLSEYLFVCRMEEARRLILHTDEKISVIANAVGYNQLNRFYVHFRTYFGVSPGSMRGRAPLPESAVQEEHADETTA